MMLRLAVGLVAVPVLGSVVHAGECMRSMTEARAREFEGLGRQ